MWFVLMAWSAVQAAPVGNPIDEPKASRLGLDLRGGTEAVVVDDKGCRAGQACTGWWHLNGVELVGRVGLVKGLGVSAELGYAAERLPEADYSGRTPVHAVSARGALPLVGSTWLAAVGRYAWGGGQAGSGGGTSTWQAGTGTALVAFGGPSAGATGWLGAQTSFYWNQHLQPFSSNSSGTLDASGTVLDLALRPTLPATAMAGASLNSDPVGLPWASCCQLTTGIEGRLGQEMGADAWLGLTW